MKALRILTLPFLFLAAACTTDFEVNGEWEDITIVYGLLDQNDSISYLKINKAFLGEGDVLMMAQEQDSGEYAYPLEVRVEEWSGNNQVRTIPFDTTTVYDKDSGQFYYPKQVLYQAVTNKLLNKESQYRLFIRNPKTGKELTSLTDLVYPFTVSKPKPSLKILDFEEEGNSVVEWTSSKNGRRYQLLIRFNYKELPLSGGDTVFRNIDWLFPSLNASNLDGGEEMSMLYSNPYFYDLLTSKIPVDPGVERFIGKKGYSETDLNAVEFIFSVASEEFSTFLDVYQPSTGVVQEKPDYTNISGENALGIFSSRTQVKRGFKLGDLTINRIRQMNLGF